MIDSHLTILTCAPLMRTTSLAGREQPSGDA